MAWAGTLTPVVAANAMMMQDKTHFFIRHSKVRELITWTVNDGNLLNKGLVRGRCANR
ncbi:hypothetical protein [Nonomuraea sp. NPDC049750]|uniref:hypothetical protein n=1 Tax=Nonomuraea sp. NPDC049750 TaxID=3154738 RepID=UPI0033EEF170